jgi:pyruvate dehydrogenase E1 component beta subunit
MIMNMVQAINTTLKQEMERDENVVLLGEDIGVNGGVFRVTEGLWKIFGDNRVIDTPLAESGIVGVSIGMAAYGMRPVPEIQFDGFGIPALDQLINHASRLRNRTRGRFSVPMTLRIPYSGGIRALEHHSDSPETYFVHTPGLKVVAPSGPYDAKGLLASAIRDPDPVIFLEPKRVYRAIKEEVPEEEFTIPIGEAKIVQSGGDITVITYGAMLKVVREAVEKIGEKYSVEVLDLRTLSPMETGAIIKSVSKTGRCVIVHEAQRTLGIAAEIIARINEKALLKLEAPVERVTGYDVVYPLPKLENYYLPNANKVIDAIEKTMSF